MCIFVKKSTGHPGAPSETVVEARRRRLMYAPSTYRQPDD
jgi:hypothetical protein